MPGYWCLVRFVLYRDFCFDYTIIRNRNLLYWDNEFIADMEE